MSRLTTTTLAQSALLMPISTPVGYSLRTNMRSLLNRTLPLSGQIAMRSLPRATGADSRQKIPRRYQDGLESDDRSVVNSLPSSRTNKMLFSEEDTTFIIWYHPHNTHKPLDPLFRNPSATVEPIIAPLSGKHKLLVCKARSRLERDAWCWALNAEIERLSRAMLTREQNIRKQGILVPER